MHGYVFKMIIRQKIRKGLNNGLKNSKLLNMTNDWSSPEIKILLKSRG